MPHPTNATSPDELSASEVERITQLVTGYLEQAHTGSIPVLPSGDPDAMLQRWNLPIPTAGKGIGDAYKLLNATLAESIHLHHPRYVGHQLSAPLPLAAVCDLVSAVLNNSTAVYEMSQVATVMEAHLVRWIAGLAGFDAGRAGGLFTSGGSLGNLTALLAARQVMGKRKGIGDLWRDGYGSGGPCPAVLVSAQAHYSVLRAVQIMGLGEQGIVPVNTDSSLRLDPSALAAAYETARRSGREPIAVAANACSTATGSYDPLERIADFCAAKDLWLHVDGAHGFGAALVPQYAPLLEGISRADSVVWDLHKMLRMPALCTALVFREKAHSYATFAQDASYLFQGTPEQEWYNLGQRTIECTKHMMALKAFVCLQVYGTQYFADYIASRYALGRRFYDVLRASTDFECPVAPQANIVCFRHVPAGVPPAALDELQVSIRQKLIGSGRFYIAQTGLSGGLYMRVTLINPLTQDSDLEALLNEVRSIAAGSRRPQ
jgi:L-2,4-diaminobutyrate decarboxylase